MATVKADYKSKLIDKIKSIQDRNILDEVNRLLEVDIEDTVYHTAPEQKKEIEIAQVQLSKGQGIPADQADQEIEKWLSK